MTLVGEMGGSADFGGGPLMTAQVFGFAAQFENDGSRRWSKMLGQAGGALPLNVETDGAATCSSPATSPTCAASAAARWSPTGQ